MIDVIIPVYNEEQVLESQIEYLRRLPGFMENARIVVVDGGSSDRTPDIARDLGVDVVLSQKGRSKQMNAGAEGSGAEVFFFLHVDSKPPKSFISDLKKAIQEGHIAACYQLGFDDPHPAFRFYGWFTRFDVNAFRFGDQGLMIHREVFEAIGGFDESLIVMEDNEIVRQIRRYYKRRRKDRPEIRDLKIIASEMITSARRYRENGIFRLQLIFSAIYILHQTGIPQDELRRFYQEWISGHN